LPPSMPPRDKLRQLDSPSLRSLVSSIRPIQPGLQMQVLAKQTLEAKINASRSPFIPPSNSASAFVQLRRVHIEKAASGDKFSAQGAFLKPGASREAGKGPAVHRPPPMIANEPPAGSSSGEWLQFN